MKSVSVFLIAAALIVGMVGCGGDGDSYTPQGQGWQPIGTPANPFTGTFDGQGYEIRDLFINRPDESQVGLFSAVDTLGCIKNLGVVNVDVTGCGHFGGLVGANEGTVSNLYSTGNVIGGPEIGGLVGVNSGTVSNSYSAVNVIGTDDVGGLVGVNYGTVSNSYSAGNVIGTDDVGGLVGVNYGTVSNSFWDIETSGQATSYGGTGKNTTEMQDILTFSGAGWDIAAVDDVDDRNTSYIWNIVDDVTYPFLARMVGCGTPSQNLEIRDWYDLDAIRDNLGGNYTLMNDIDSTTAGYEELASPTATEF